MKRKSKSRKSRRCKYGVNKRNGKCLKSPRRSIKNKRNKKSKNKSCRRTNKRSCKAYMSFGKRKRKRCNYTSKKIQYKNCDGKKYSCEKIKTGLFKAIINEDRSAVKKQKSLAKKYKCPISRTASQVSADAYSSLFS